LIEHLRDFFYCPYFSQSSPQVKLRLSRSQLMAQMVRFQARRCLFGFSMKSNAICRKYAPPHNGREQAISSQIGAIVKSQYLSHIKIKVDHGTILCAHIKG